MENQESPSRSICLTKPEPSGPKEPSPVFFRSEAVEEGHFFGYLEVYVRFFAHLKSAL